MALEGHDDYPLWCRAVNAAYFIPAAAALPANATGSQCSGSKLSAVL
ncbi:hypothetical protein ART_1367 [Arthrobacter sp. PAMC 25486]|nr:hypothetical protein [Arthrobacter sp. PAMC 25486]AIY00966.1 hypothetical protein ART_1367 [Arthrobacter sp. PAMC 25486]